MRISDWSSDVCSSDLLLRTEMWPVWIGLPLGLVDDLFSGAPIGTAVCLWTLASIAIHYFAQRIYWRGFFHDWGIAALLLAAVQAAAALIAHPDAPTGRVLGLDRKSTRLNSRH